MITKRQCSEALCTETALIVAGGFVEESTTLQTLEVMNTETLQWYTAAELPDPVLCAQGAVCGDHVHVYIILLSSLENDSRYMYTCPVIKCPHPVLRVNSHS